MDESFSGWNPPDVLVGGPTPPTSSTTIVDPTSLLLSTALVWLLTILALASVTPPLSRLGERPRGRYVWEWAWNGLTSSSAASSLYGYDVVQGALAPTLRLQCHGVAILLLWSVLSMIGLGSIEEDDHLPFLLTTTTMGWWKTGLSATLLYTVGCLISSFFMDGVSMPGGPRTFKMNRHPQWDNLWTSATSTTTTTTSQEDRPSSWKCLVAQESHDYTQTQFERSLTGEPAGRQMWVPISASASSSTASPTENVVSKLLRAVSGGGGGSNPGETSDKATNQLIRELAKGGRAEFGFNPSINPNSCDMLFRYQQIQAWVTRHNPKDLPDLQAPPPTTVPEAAKRAAFFYSLLQCEDGHWAADYGGPHFLMPGLVTAWYVMGQPEAMLSKTEHVPLLIKYILCHQQSDGGWGTHLESPSTMFGSTLMYVALRLLGVAKDHPAALKGQAFLKQQGGALYTSSWSKFYLCLLGLMDWKGHNSVPPEMWLLPHWCPFHPGRMWCHARMVYLPMGYLYGHRFVYPKAETDPLIASLRQELYTQEQPYETIDWVPTRHWVADMDNYSPIPWMMKTVQNLLAWYYENAKVVQPLKAYLRQKGLAFSMDYIRAEDLQTNYIDIGPVNKVLNMISHFHGTYYVYIGSGRIGRKRQCAPLLEK